MDANVTVARHPLVLHKLAELRQESTQPPAFRALVHELARMLFFEATQDLKTIAATVRTPLADCPAQRIGQRVALVPILRAGLGMAEAILDFVPDARIWHLGLYRDHETLRPVTYYNKLSARADSDVTFVVDPMLATGGSAIAAIDILKRWGAADTRFLGLIAAPEGVRALRDAHPDVRIHLGAIDSHLNEHSYIVPGLGDAGDRQFGTAP